MKCTSCGKNVPLHSKVCPGCGKDNPEYEPRRQTIRIHPSSLEGYNGGENNSSGQGGSQTGENKEIPKTDPIKKEPNSQPVNKTTSKSGEKSETEEKGSSFKSFLILAIVVIGIIFLVKQCNARQLVGTWVAEDGKTTITFSDDEKGYIKAGVSMSSNNTIDFTYFIDGDEVEIKTVGTLYHYSKVQRFEFEITGDTLCLTETDTGIKTTFRKK